MLPWRDHSAPNKVLVIALAIVAVYVFVIDRENDNAALLMAALFAVVFVYHFVDFARARERREKALGDAALKQPLLAGPPATMQSSDVPDGGRYQVYDIETGDELGEVAGYLLRELIEFHEHAGMETNDFFILAETPTILEDLGKSEQLIGVLKDWLDQRDSMQIRWVPCLPGTGPDPR